MPTLMGNAGDAFVARCLTTSAMDHNTVTPA